jgi:FkbM family methyltransferase
MLGLSHLVNVLRKSRLPGSMFVAAFLEAVVPGYWNSYWRSSRMETLLNLLNIQPCEAVLDVGANVGIFSIEAAKKVGPCGTVIPVEPGPYNVMALRIRARHNPNVRIVSAAVLNHVGTVELYRSSVSLWHTVRPAARTSIKDRAATDTTQVRCTTVDELTKTLLLSHVDIMKVAVEGSEIEVLEGARQTIPQCRAISVQCVANPEELEEKMLAVIRFLQEYGFSHSVLRLGPSWTWVVFSKDRIFKR